MIMDCGATITITLNTLNICKTWWQLYQLFWTKLLRSYWSVGRAVAFYNFFFFFLNTGTAAYENSFFFLLSRLQDSRKKRKHWKGWLLCNIYHCEYVHGLILTTGGTWKLAKEVASDYWQRWKRADCLDDGFSFWDVQFQVACIKELQII